MNGNLDDCVVISFGTDNMGIQANTLHWSDRIIISASISVSDFMVFGTDNKRLVSSVKSPWVALVSVNTGNNITDIKMHGANMGPTEVLAAPGASHVGPMNLATRDSINGYTGHIARIWRDLIHGGWQYRGMCSKNEISGIITKVESWVAQPCPKV